MDQADAVIESANATLQTVGADAFAKLTSYALRLTGSEIARHVDADDRPGLFAPVDVVVDGKDRTGAVLALEDRAVIGWTVGTLKIKNFETVIPYATIDRVDQTTRPAGAMSKEREPIATNQIIRRCSSPSFCMDAFNTSAGASHTEFDGSEWTEPRPIPGLGRESPSSILTAMACPSDGHCLVLGDDGNLFEYRQ